MIATLYDNVADSGYGYRVPADVMKENWVATETPTKEKSSKVVTSRIRVYLSRPLTWAEKEDLETDYTDPDLRRIDGKGGFKVWVSENHEHVWAEAEFGSRLLFELIAVALEDSFVNVYPKAVRTFREYNG